MLAVARKDRDGRYDLTNARDPGQRGEPVRHAVKAGNISPGLAAVIAPVDPFDLNVATTTKKKKKGNEPGNILATVNRKVDLLEWELSHRWITHAAYSEGRIIQGLFERAGLSGGSTWSDSSRVDAVTAKENAACKRLVDGNVIRILMAELRSILGAKNIDVAIVRQVLGENRAYVDVEIPQRPPIETRRDVAYVAQRFRDALELLARERGQR
jgi:hypothetical protein